MLIDVKVIRTKKTSDFSIARNVDSRVIFNAEAIPIENTYAELEFLDKLTDENWTRVPKNLLDYKTSKTFMYFAKMPSVLAK